MPQTIEVGTKAMLKADHKLSEIMEFVKRRQGNGNSVFMGHLVELQDLIKDALAV